MKKNVLMAIAISAMSLAACKKDDPEEITLTKPVIEPTESTSQSPIPLKIGNQWVYNVYSVRYDVSGNTLSERLEQTDTLTILRKEVIDNYEYYVVTSCLTCGIPQNQSSPEEYLRLENGRLVGPRFKTNYSIHSLPEPLDSFIVDSFIKIIYYVQPYDASVVLPAGDFDNVIETLGKTYYYDNSENRYVRYEKNDTQSLYSPQVGLLADKMYTSGRTSGFRRELISYTLN